jgi:hypothetical protein
MKFNYKKIMSHSNNERGSQMEMVQPSYYKNSKPEMNNFKWKQKQDNPLAKMFFYFICRNFYLFSIVKIPKMNRLVSFVYRCPSVLDSYSLRQYRGDSCR